VYDVVVLALSEGDGVRAPMLALRDALSAGGARVEVATASSDADIDAVVKDDQTRLVVAAAVDGQVRAVVRRLVRGYAVPPGPVRDGVPADRTVRDLPPIGILPLGPGADLAARLGLPRDPAAVAAAVLGERIRRLDLLRTDSGSVTLDGALLGAADAAGRAVSWYARVEVDDAILTDGTDPLLVAAIANGPAYSTVDGLPLVHNADPADGVVEVAVAVPVVVRRQIRVEVRRSRGRAVVVTPRNGGVPVLDDGVPGELDRRRSWWIERAAWAVYT
jgi:hypothetical protein